MNPTQWPFYYWFLVLGLLLIGGELILGAQTGFDLLLLGIALLLGAATGWISHSWPITVIQTTLLFAGYFLFGRALIRRRLFLATKTIGPESLIGKIGVVTKTISPENPGQVKVEGELWRAISEETIKAGEKVKIVAIEGVSLICQKE